MSFCTPRVRLAAGRRRTISCGRPGRCAAPRPCIASRRSPTWQLPWNALAARSVPASFGGPRRCRPRWSRRSTISRSWCTRFAGGARPRTRDRLDGWLTLPGTCRPAPMPSARRRPPPALAPTSTSRARPPRSRSRSMHLRLGPPAAGRSRARWRACARCAGWPPSPTARRSLKSSTPSSASVGRWSSTQARQGLRPWSCSPPPPSFFAARPASSGPATSGMRPDRESLRGRRPHCPDRRALPRRRLGRRHRRGAQSSDDAGRAVPAGGRQPGRTPPIAARGRLAGRPSLGAARHAERGGELR
jgi:hypothetical protein